MLTPAMRPISRDHWPHAMTSFSQATKPSAVSTPRDAPSSTRIDRDRRVLADRHAGGPRAARQRLHDVARARLAVGRQERRADHVVDRHQRKELLRLLRREQVHLEPEAARGRRLPLHLGPALGVAGEPQAAVPLPAGGEAGLGLEPVVERDRIAEELRDVGVGAELTDEAGRVPGRPGGELGALQQQHVAPAHLAEMIGDRAADDAAADDHDLRRGGQAHARLIALKAA